MKIYADEIHKPFKKPKYLRKMKFKSKDHIWNADLIIMPEEDEFKYILTVLDGYTRYAWAIPLKHKDAKSVSNAFKEIFKKSKRKPNKLFVDEGKEFYNSEMYKLFKFKKQDILEQDDKGNYKNDIYSVFNASKNPVIERFNRTLTNKLWKQFTINGNQKWLDILQPTVSKYNNTIHSSISTTPSLASKDPSKVKIQEEIKYPEKQKFKLNDRVRIFKWKNKFEKGYRGYWSKEIFKITEIKKTNPIMYKIQDLNNEDIHGSLSIQMNFNELCSRVFKKHIFNLKMPLLTGDGFDKLQTKKQFVNLYDSAHINPMIVGEQIKNGEGIFSSIGSLITAGTNFVKTNSELIKTGTSAASNIASAGKNINDAINSTRKVNEEINQLRKLKERIAIMNKTNQKLLNMLQLNQNQVLYQKNKKKL